MSASPRMCERAAAARYLDAAGRGGALSAWAVGVPWACAPPSLDKAISRGQVRGDSAGQTTGSRMWTRQRMCGACECERRCGEARLWVQAASRSGPKRSLFRYHARKASGGVKGILTFPACQEVDGRTRVPRQEHRWHNGRHWGGVRRGAKAGSHWLRQVLHTVRSRMTVAWDVRASRHA